MQKHPEFALVSVLCLCLLATIPGCSDDPSGPGPDRTPPAVVSDLSVREVSPTTVSLSWTAPGDDEHEGQAAEYDLRYSEDLSDPFDSMSPVGDIESPRDAGRSEHQLVEGLVPHTSYGFRIRTRDDEGNWSRPSNPAAAQTAIGSALSFSQVDFSVKEGEGSLLVAIRRSGVTTDSASVEVVTENGSAHAGDDYEPLSMIVGFSPLQDEALVELLILDDDSVSGDRSFRVRLENVEGGAFLATPATAQCTILEDDSLVGFAVSSQVVREGDVLIPIEVVRAGSLSDTASVQFLVTGGEAEEGEDFSLVEKNLIFLPSEMRRQILIAILDDEIVEAVEQIELTLHSAQGSSIDRVSTSLRIEDDEDLTVGVSGSAFRFLESAGRVSIPLQVTGHGFGTFSVQYDWIEGSAEDGSDYVASSGVFEFGGPGEGTTVELTILDDRQIEMDETLALRLSAPIGGVRLGQDDAAITIETDDFVEIGFRSSVVSVVEDDTVLWIPVFRTGEGIGPVSVGYHTGVGSAREGVDFETTANVLHFSDVADSAFIQVSILDDHEVESLERFPLELEDSVAGVILGPLRTCIVELVDDEAVFVFPVSDRSVPESAERVLIPITKAGGTRVSTLVRVFHHGGSAEEGKDFEIVEPFILFAPEEVRKEIELRIIDDGLFEPAETIEIGISYDNQPAYTPTTRVRIEKNDDPEVGLQASGFEVDESKGRLRIPVVRRGGLSEAISVDCATEPLTATEGSDFEPYRDTVRFEAHQAIADVFIPILDDRHVEGNESFRIRLSRPSENVLVNTSEAQVTIVDNDGYGVRLEVTPTSVAEGEILGAGVVRVGNGSGSGPVRVRVRTVDRAAEARSDYAGFDTLIDLTEVGSTGRVIQALLDGLVEGDEDFIVEIDEVEGATLLGPSRISVVIRDSQ